MHIEGFDATLDTVADEFYNETYDDFHPFEYVSNKPVRTKRVMFYKMMRLGDT